MRSQGDLGGRRVLVVDDEPADRDAIGRLAKAHRCEVRDAGSHADMVAIMRTWEPQMLVIDIVMPEVDGIGVLRRLAEAHCRIPVLLVSAYNEMLKPVHNLGSVYGLRVVGEISKPVKARAFEVALQRAFGTTNHASDALSGETDGRTQRR